MTRKGRNVVWVERSVTRDYRVIEPGLRLPPPPRLYSWPRGQATVRRQKCDSKLLLIYSIHCLDKQLEACSTLIKIDIQLICRMHVFNSIVWPRF